MRKLKKAFSLTLALALSLALAAPAFAADTVKVLEDKEYGVKVTLNGFLREETHRYYVDGIFYYDEDTGEPITEEAREFTICVVADNSTVTLEALEGWKYGDPSWRASTSGPTSRSLRTRIRRNMRHIRIS